MTEVEELRAQLAAAVRRGHKAAAASIRADLDKLTKGREKAIQPPRETR